jgi:hypothetical protein
MRVSKRESATTASVPPEVSLEEPVLSPNVAPPKPMLPSFANAANAPPVCPALNAGDIVAKLDCPNTFEGIGANEDWPKAGVV